VSNSFQKPQARFLPSIFFAVFLLTFVFFEFYGVSVQVLRRSPVLVGIVVIGFPLVTLLSSIVFIFFKKTAMFVTMKIMTAFCTALVMVMCLSYEPDNSVADIFARMQLMVTVGVLFVILAIIATKNHIHKAQPSGLQTQWLFRDVLLTILAGWISGLSIWSLILPATVIRAAEEIALDIPYCIDADGTAVHSLLDLTAPRMYSRRENGYAFNFHGLLKVGLTDSRYFSWSYRQNAFLELRPYTVDAMHLATSTRCQPVLHFSKNLPLLVMSKN
jgi:hypothetical protein